MTLEFLDFVSDDLLDFRPGPEFQTIREQGGHLSRAQGVFQLTLRGEDLDFGREFEFAPASLERGDIVAALAARDRELVELLDALRPRADTHRIRWYRAELTIPDFEGHHVYHEALHHGQWAAYAALDGHARPPDWVAMWKL